MAEGFVASVGIGAAVQEAQIQMGLRSQFDVILIFEQAVAQLASAKINAQLAKARVSASVANGVDEFANATTGMAFGYKPDITSLAANYVGDEMGNVIRPNTGTMKKHMIHAQSSAKAETVGRHVTQPHSAANDDYFNYSTYTTDENPFADDSEKSTVGYAPDPTQFTNKALQTESCFIAESVVADEIVTRNLTAPFYSVYCSHLSESVNDIAQTNYAAQSAAMDNQAAQVRVQRVQQAANNTSWENKLAQTIYHHQNSWWAKGILGFSDALNSDAGKWLLNSLHSDAAMVENLNPFNAIATAATGFDALTHQSVTTVQAYEDFAASTVGLFSGEVADAALGYAGKMLPSLGRNWAGFFGGQLESVTQIGNLSALNTKTLNDFGSVDVKLANNEYTSRGYFAPYNEKYNPRNIALNHDRIFMRVHGEDNQVSKWMMRSSEIEGLTPMQIQDKFALEFTPKYMSEVHVPVGSNMRVSIAGQQTQWGVNGGGTQYELMQRISESSFKFRVPIYTPITQPDYFMEPLVNWSSIMNRR